MKKITQFQSENILFIPLEEAHIAPINVLHSFAEVAKFNTIGVPKDVETTAKILANKLSPLDKKALGWALYNSENDFIGEAGINLAPKRFLKAEISYALLPSQWNMGLGTELAKQLIKYCFNQLNLHRVEAGVAIYNHASIRVLEKVGMLREGMHRKILPLASGWTDNFSYALLKEEWNGLDGYLE